MGPPVYKSLSDPRGLSTSPSTPQAPRSHWASRDYNPLPHFFAIIGYNVFWKVYFNETLDSLLLCSSSSVA